MLVLRVQGEKRRLGRLIFSPVPKFMGGVSACL